MPSSPAAAGVAPARAALAGNPSDGYGGAVLAVCLPALAARVEVDAARVPELSARHDLLAAVRGFDCVEVDPRGFRSGSMNELLPDPVRYR